MLPLFRERLDASRLVSTHRRGFTTQDARLRCAALALLPPFLRHLAADHQRRVLDALADLVSECFPLSSREYPAKSTQV